MDEHSSLVEIAQGFDDINVNFPHEQWNIFQYACSIQDKECIDWLLSKKAKVNTTSTSKVIPFLPCLMIAVRYGDFDTVKKLASKTDLNEPDQWGFTALHYAVVARNVDIVQYLTKNGVSVSLKSRNGSTALDIANALEYSEIIDILEESLRVQNDPSMEDFRSWLSSLGAVEYFSKFVDAGYDLPFIVKYGLKNEDLDCVGIPISKLGMRRKILALHNIEQYYEISENEESEEENEELSVDNREDSSLE